MRRAQRIAIGIVSSWILAITSLACRDDDEAVNPVRVEAGADAADASDAASDVQED